MDDGTGDGLCVDDRASFVRRAVGGRRLFAYIIWSHSFSTLEQSGGDIRFRTQRSDCNE